MMEWTQELADFLRFCELERLNRIAYGVLLTYLAEKGRNNYIQGLRADLAEFVDRSNELVLPVETTGFVGHGALLDPGSEAMLRWLGARTDTGAKRLVDDLLDRRLMKRVLICSQARESEINWKAVGRIYGEIGASWETKHAISNDVAQRIAGIVASWDGARRTPGSQASPVSHNSSSQRCKPAKP